MTKPYKQAKGNPTPATTPEWSLGKAYFHLGLWKNSHKQQLLLFTAGC